MSPGPPALRDDFQRDPPYPPDYLFPQAEWSGLGDLDDLRFLERRLSREWLLPLSFVRLRERLGFALLTMDMQNRWKQAWSEAGSRNRLAVEHVVAAARACPTQPVMLLGALDAVCALYPDPGVRPAHRLAVLVRSGEAAEAVRAALPPGSPVVVTTTLPLQVDAAPLIADSAPAQDTPPPTFEGLYITQDAPRLTRDATRSAADAAQPEGPPRPRPRVQGGKQGDASPPPVRVDEAPNVRLMRREHALLMALAAWAERPDEARRGLHAWEITEMTRRWPLDWKALVAETRRLGLSGIVGAALDEVHDTWRGQVPAEAREALRGGLIARWALRALGPRAAQRLLRAPLLRRL